MFVVISCRQLGQVTWSSSQVSKHVEWKKWLQVLIFLMIELFSMTSWHIAHISSLSSLSSGSSLKYTDNSVFWFIVLWFCKFSGVLFNPGNKVSNRFGPGFDSDISICSVLLGFLVFQAIRVFYIRQATARGACLRLHHFSPPSHGR